MFRAPHRLIEGCLITAHAIGSQNVFIYIRGEYLHEFEVLRAALDEVARRAGCSGGVTVVLHRGAGAYICGEETALLESLEGKRGQPRSKPPFPAVAGPLRLADADQQRRDDRDRAGDHRARRRLVRLARRRRTRPGRASSRSRATSCNGGNYELELGTSLRELIYDIGGGIPDGRKLKAVIPGGSSVPVLTARRDRHAARLRLDGRGRDDARLRRGDRDRRPLLHGAARPAGRAVLHARVVRQVHAVPRGDALDGADPPRDRGRATPSTASSTCCSTSATASSASACARSATRRRCRSPSYVDKFRDEFRQHIDEGGCPFGGESSLEGIVAAGRPARATTHPSRCDPAHESRRAELVTVTIDGREVQVPEGDRLVETALRPGSRSRSSATSRGWGRAVGACRMCLVRGRGHAEAPGRLHDDRAGRDGRPHRADLREGRRGPERDARVHPRQPPARLPGLRQGRRVPAPGPDVPLGPRQHADGRSRSARSTSRSRSRRRSRSTASAASSATAARASPRASPRTASWSRATAARSR